MPYLGTPKNHPPFTPLSGTPETTTGKGTPVHPKTLSTTGFENRLKTEAPHLSKGQRKALAKRIAWRMQHAIQFVDAPEDTIYETGLKILGIHADTTAYQAVTAVESPGVSSV